MKAVDDLVIDRFFIYNRETLDTVVIKLVQENIIRIILGVAFLSVLASCSSGSDELLKLPKYDGPVREVYNSTILYSDSAVVKLKVDAPVQYDLENGDREYPEGIYLEFYDDLGEITNTLRANYCYYTAAEKTYKATGDVVLKGLKTNDQLNTEELFWNQQTEKIYTEKFVRIENEGVITMGHGLEADQDFSSYTIKESSGSINLDQE